MIFSFALIESRFSWIVLNASIKELIAESLAAVSSLRRSTSGLTVVAVVSVLVVLSGPSSLQEYVPRVIIARATIQMAEIPERNIFIVLKFDAKIIKALNC